MTDSAAAAMTTDKEAADGAADGEPLARGKRRRSPPCGRAAAAAANAKAGGASIFRPFTLESMQRIQLRIEEEARAKELAKKQQEEEEAAAGADGKQGGGDGAKKEEDEPEPNEKLEAGKTLPDRLGPFPQSLYGKPIEDLDDFYDDKYVTTDKRYFHIIINVTVRRKRISLFAYHGCCVCPLSTVNITIDFLAEKSTTTN